MRLNVLPHPGPAQPPPQIIGRPSDVERLLDEVGRAQEVERGAEAIEETAAVAAEEGEVAVAAEGVGGAFGYLGGLAEGAAALAPTAGEVAGTLAGAAGVGAAATAGLQMQLGSLQYPHNPMKGASEHFHFLSVLAGTYDDRVRNIDIGRVGYLRHSFIAGFPTECVPKMPLSGVSTRSGDLARFTFKGLDGTMTDLFIHLVAYQLVTLSGTGVSVLD